MILLSGPIGAVKSTDAKELIASFNYLQSGAFFDTD
jgi:adenylate kinase family enzyme